MIAPVARSRPLETRNLANGQRWRRSTAGVLAALLVVWYGVGMGSAVAAGTDVGPLDRLCFSVAGSPGDAAIVNLTPVLAQGPGNGQLISSDVTSPPLASNVNYGPGTVDPNVAVARIGADGKVCYSNSEHTSVHLVADHLGTIDASAYTPATPTGAPTRTVDTRIGQGGGIVGPSGRLCFSVAGSPGDAAIVNLTPVLAQGPGNGQLISSDVTSPPLASNVNYGPGTVDPNVAVARIGADGKVCYSNSEHTSVHLVADHLGTIDASAYTPATPTGAPTRTVDTRISFEDEFDGYLRAGWQWVPGGFTGWSLTQAPGTLRIDAASALGEVNALIRPAPTSDFEMATVLRFEPSSNFQFAGLIVYQSPTDFLKLGRAFCDLPATCVGDGLYFDSVTAGVYAENDYSVPWSTSGDIFVRIRAEGLTFTAYYSIDGNTWIRLGSITRSFATPQIGLVAHQSASGIIAEFDSFKVNILGE